MGQVEPTADDQYETRKQALLDLEKKVGAVVTKMSAYLDASRAMCFTTAEVGASVKDVSQWHPAAGCPAAAL